MMLKNGKKWISQRRRRDYRARCWHGDQPVRVLRPARAAAEDHRRRPLHRALRMFALPIEVGTFMALWRLKVGSSP
jgi:hypothetical protein